MQGIRGRKSRVRASAIVALFVFVVGAQSAAAAPEPPLLTNVRATAVTGASAILKAEIHPGELKTSFSFEVGLESCELNPCAVVADGSVPAGTTPVAQEAPVAGLEPNTVYHYRVVAKNSEGEATSGDRVLYTRAGVFSGLPDSRAYEQASPVNKDGGDVLGDVPTIKAAFSGGGITFASTFGIPGGKGAQEFPTYLGSRGSSNWSTQGLLPPPDAGERAQVVGWSPNYTEVFSNVSRLEAKKVSALIVQSISGGEPVQITPYLPNSDYVYAGQSQDGSVVLFESRTKLVPEALEEFPNLYAWDRESEEISLAGILNDGKSPPKGALAGPYAWVAGSSGRPLSLGGADRGFYLLDERAIAPDGSIYFTEAGTGQLYRRLNPTEPQSAMSAGKCTEPTKACTVHISASHKTNGKGKGGSDSAGPQPAAFQAASADGSEVFFTSPEKLTNDANTGPEQAAAQIERDDLAGEPVEDPEFITPQAAIGITTDAEHIYWVDPTGGTIGRADLDGNLLSRDTEFIKPGTVKCEIGETGTFEDVPSRPRYVAVDSEHVYWTNTGCSDEFGPLEKTGTIGRAEIDGAPASIEAEFITGASDPQGIAVNATHIYWASAGRFAGLRAIGRAEIGGGKVEQSFKSLDQRPFGVALNSTYVYFSRNEESNDNGSIRRIPLDGGIEEFLGVGKAGVRGVAVDAGHVYWAHQADQAIGRANLDLELASREKEFIKLEGKPNGVAVNSEHLYWATNGESPGNPGNDLYRHGPNEGELTDLTPLATGNGAEVQGVLGASADGSYVYFAANGVLDDAEEATQGDCEGPLGSASGSCSLYLWHEGAISLVARLDADGSQSSDALNWAATPRGQFGTSSYFPKTSFTSADGQTLLFRSQEQLSAYENEGVPEYYRFEVGDPEGIRCVSCNPAGEAAGDGPRIGRTIFPGIGPLASVTTVSARVLSASGDQAFFETSEALVPEDTNGQGGCPISGTSVQFYPACNDVYEWEAPGAGTCTESSPAYSPLNAGCVYLISTGKSKYPSLFADASASGQDVFFFTREALVGQDKDELQDVYDARVGGGLAAQNPLPVVPCGSVESCHGSAQSPPAEPSAGSATFVGPGNEVVKHKKQKKKKKKAKKGKGKGKKRANTKGRTAR